MGSPHHRLRLVTGVVVLAWLGLVSWFCWHLGGKSLDDFFITFRYAQNLVDGKGFVFNPGERVFGLTAPGMGLFLGALYALTDVAIPWLGSISTGAAFLVIAGLLLRALAELGRWASGVVGGSLVLTSTYLWACHGAEGPLALALLLIAAQIAGRAPATAGAVGALAVWFRPDAVLGLSLVILLCWLEQRRFPVLLVLGAGAVLGAGLLWAWIYFGQALPNTWLAKRTGAGAFAGGSGLSFWSAGEPLWRRHFGPFYPVMAIAGLLGQGFMVRSRSRVVRLLAWYGLSLVAAYPLLGVGFAPWYAIPVLTSLLYGLAVALGALWRTGPTVPRLGIRVGPVAALVLLGAVLASAVPKGIVWLAAAESPVHYDGYRRAGLWIKADSSPTDAIAFVEIGTLGFFSERRIEDLMGLVTPRSIPFVARGDLEGAFLAQPTKYVVLRLSLEGLMGQISSRRWFQRNYREVVRFYPETDNWIAVYRLRPGSRWVVDDAVPET